MNDTLELLAQECPAGREILAELAGVAEMLLTKNRAYGDSALNPIRVFARNVPIDTQIRVRLDDKLSRLMRGQAAGEDVELDLIGYLVLLRISRRRTADQGDVAEIPG